MVPLLLSIPMPPGPSSGSQMVVVSVDDGTGRFWPTCNAAFVSSGTFAASHFSSNVSLFANSGASVLLSGTCKLARARMSAGANADPSSKFWFHLMVSKLDPLPTIVLGNLFWKSGNVDTESVHPEAAVIRSVKQSPETVQAVQDALVASAW